MTYENIQIQYGNFAIDRGFDFYTVDHIAGTLIAKTSVGVAVATYTLATSTKEVLSLQYDGYYFWTLDVPITSGFRVRKWEIGADTIVRVVSDYLYSPDSINTYNVNALAVEAYTDSFDNQEVTGTLSFDVVDGQTITPGDDLVLGPSSATGFVGIHNFTTVINKVGNTVTVNVPLGATFSPGDPISFARNFFAFSDTAPGNLVGALYKYKVDNGNVLSMDVSGMYGGVRAATFFKNKLMFIRGSEIIWLNPDSQTIFKSQAIENGTANRAGYIDTFDISGSSETVYRLEQEHVFYNPTFSRWEAEDWDPLYNYNESGVVPVVYSVAIVAQPQILHRFDSITDTNFPGSLDSEIVVTVLDQFRTPVVSKVVDMSSTGGALSSIQETTDANGRVSTTYSANSFVGDVEITVTVN